MVDTVRLKEYVDCRTLVEADLGQPQRRGGKAWNWRCPFHHEQKGYSLAVWTERWYCFGACQMSGDAIDWLQRYRGLDFRAACRELGTQDTDRLAQRRPSRRRILSVSSPLVVSEPPADAWQTAALSVVEEAEAALWKSEGARALAYLENRRGLLRPIIRQARLGYIPGDFREWRKLHGLSVPCGITIPWITEGVLWALKVRRAAGPVRYEQVAGANLAGSLYWADNLVAGWPVLLVEGELNCLTAWQEAMDLVCPVSLGSASMVLDPRWYAVLATSSQILACYDQDEAGNKARRRIRDLTPRARFIQVPEGKDINDYYLLHRQEPVAVYKWLERLLSPS